MINNLVVSTNLSINTSQFTPSEYQKITSENEMLRNENISCWDYWQNWYYPQIIYPSYPVYIQERAKDNGKKAYEIIKILKDKKLIEIKTVGKFVDLMDELIKIL